MERDEIYRITKELEELLEEQKPDTQPDEAAKAENPLKPRAAAEQSDTEYDVQETEEDARPDSDHAVPSLRERLWSLPVSSEQEGRWGSFVAFLMPMVVMLIIFWQRNIFPFGEQSFLRTDMYHQYAPFFSEFQHKLTEGGSLLYSWDVGMGVNFAALYAYYLASPLNWLLVFCPKELVIEFMTYMIVFKIGLSGWAMSYYLRKHCRSDSFGTAFFGIFYALSGYMAAYSWNIMWLDCIWLFPLIVLALEKLVREKQGVPYCLLLGLSILSNYYISIMTCMFLVLYFIALLVLEADPNWERFMGHCLRFGFLSLLAGGLAAAVLLPEIYALQMTASGDFHFPKDYSQYFSIFDMLARHIGNVETEIGLDHWPNLYCGVAVLMLFGLYLTSKRIPVKEKVVCSTLLLFLFASFSINVLNFIWHGFHYPNSLPCRQSYIYIFLVLLMCFQAYEELAILPRRKVIAAFWGAVAFVLLAQKLVTTEHFHFIVFYVALLFLVLYLGVFMLYMSDHSRKSLALFLGLALVLVEAAVNTTVTSVTTTSRTSYIEDNAAVQALIKQIYPGSTFFRVEKVSRKTKNDGAWLNFPSVSLFSSVANADLTNLFKRLGCEGSTNAYSITGATPLIDMLFAVRYGLYSRQPDPSAIRQPVAQEGEVWLSENICTLPLGFLMPEGMEKAWNLELSNPADVQNSLCEALGTGPVLQMISDVNTEGKTLTFYPREGGEYYAYVEGKQAEKITVKTWKGTQTFQNVDRGYLLELGYCEAGEEVRLTADGDSTKLWADVYRFSEENLKAVYETLSASEWSLKSWKDTSLEGSIIAPEGGVMMTTIPYENGWSVRVDGIEQPKKKVLDAFIGVDLTPGSHTVSMIYRPEGLDKGRILTASSILILALFAAGQWFWNRYLEKYDLEEFWEDEA